MISGLISRLVILVFGTLYPAYASYKAVKTKNVKEYVKWMMYWIVFAFFTTIETFADIFVAWLPFYYELKIVFVIWLLSPATKGASILYRKFVHPQLNKREKEIDTYLTKVSDQGYSALVTLGSRGFNYATNVVVNTAIKGQSKLADQLKKSYSLNDLDGDENMEFRPSGEDIEEEDETDNRIIEERYQREMMERDEDEERKIKREVIEVSDDESPKKVTKKHATAQKETLTTKSTASSGSSAGMSLSTRTTPPVSKTSTGSGGAAKTSGGIGASAAAGARGTKGGLGLPSSSSSGGGVGGSGQSWRLRSTYSSSAWK